MRNGDSLEIRVTVSFECDDVAHELNSIPFHALMAYSASNSAETHVVQNIVELSFPVGERFHTIEGCPTAKELLRLHVVAC